MEFNQNKKKIELVDRAYSVTTSLIRVSLVLAIVTSIISLRWTVLFVSVGTLLLTFLPKAFEKKYHVQIPVELEIVIILFIYASLFLGEVHGYYEKFYWWDILLHTGSAIALGFIGFILLFILYKGNKLRAQPITIAIFTFFFAMGIGAVWEIFEFAMDQLFGFTMQKSGLIDTMWDLIVDAIGALIAAISGYFYIKNEDVLIFDKVVKRFIKENPKMFEE